MGIMDGGLEHQNNQSSELFVRTMIFVIYMIKYD